MPLIVLQFNLRPAGGPKVRRGTEVVFDFGVFGRCRMVYENVEHEPDHGARRRQGRDTCPSSDASRSPGYA